ncbi:uncharacterized protein LOC135203613 isoform X1 [Macrobrachium nipponense]|uniref:uncharacterized protein LOC135203613 isoform X1 n=1 Tax=Macrobrachium nipponense TaxID=159736 RepID=UPI0030C82B29
MLRAHRLWALGAALVLLNLCPSLVGAQLGIDSQNASGELCECSPTCEGDVGGSSGTGCHGRIVPREDCPCCKVCAQGVGSPCAPPALPCDSQFGLVCSAESICEAAQVCQSDNDCPDDRFCLGTACVDPCPILTPCEGAIQGGECSTKDHVAQCRCPEGTIKNSAGTNCMPNNGTTEGCQYEGRLYAAGEVRYSGECQEQCRCGTDGQFACGPVSCPIGLFLTGQHSKEELCIELRNRPETDECCVVVVCANNQTHPSLLISPGSHRLGPISGEEASSLRGNSPPLSGRSVSQERPKPITEDEYQRRLKDLEQELNKDQSEKKPTGSKLNSNHTEIEKEHPTKVTESDDSVQKDVLPVDVADVTEESQVETSTHLDDISEQATTVPSVQLEDELVTTMMPDVQQDDEEAATETPIPAVVVELNEHGHEVHKITVGEAIEVVTQPIGGGVESTTLGAEMEETTTQPPTEEMTTELTPVEDEVGFVSAREGKMAPEDTILTNESTGVMKEKDDVTGRSAAGGLKVLAVTHNSSTLVLPSTKGGDVYYKSSDGTEWQRVNVEAGQDSFVLKGLQPKTEYTLKWSGESSGSAKMTIKTEDGCIVENVSYGVGQDWAIGCDQRCSCRPGGKPSCQPRCLFLPGAVQDPLCTEVPYPEDPECCVTYECKKEDTNPVILDDKRTPGQPKLLVTGETHNSVTLAWDDFRAKTHEGGYVVEYREEKEVGSAGPETPWMRKELPTGQIPKHTVDNLKPNTIYEVRVSIYDETDDSRPGESTETLTVRTQPGCLYNNESHVVGEFFIGCEKRCMCLVSGDVKCFERCSIPYFRVNYFKDDPLCREVPEEGDECCVMVQCASGDSTVTEVENGTSITNMTNDNCSQTVCGANAVCVSHTMNVDILNLSDNTPLVFGRCQCLDGFISKPSDPNSCIPDPTRNIKEGVCTFKSNTYQPGEVFYNECEYRCSCNNNTEIECEPRCEFTHKNGSKVEPGCEYTPDPEDSCCMLRVCNSTSETAGDAGRSPSLISDGCTVDNVTYAKDEKFYKGCQTQCVCMGFGDVSCVPRCPPLKVLVSDTAKHCQTLPDPEDSCCSITVCDEETPDVMKANITEMEKEMIMMKERMKNTTEMEKEMLMKRMTELEREMLMENISQLDTVLRNMIEEKNVLINSNISDSEKDMLKKNMLEIEMMMKDVVEMEKDITTRNLTDEEKETLKSKLTAMQRNLTDELLSEGKNDIDEHTRLHLLGIEHSHDMDGKKNNTHTHDDGTTHSHHDGHLAHTHDEKNNTHTHEDGITHTHTGGHLPHTHDEMNVTHTHEDGTTHTHPGGHLPHTHDEMNVTHTHEDGTTHTHPGGHLPHTHDDMNVTHTHEDGMTHSHPGGHLPHTHDDMNVTHTHEDGTTHTHPGGHLPHTHDDMNHTHIHPDLNDVEGLHSHAHTHGNDTHSHDHMDGSHNETHHMHEDGTVHLHHNMPGQENETHHMHEDGEVHLHHNMPGWKNDTHHMHEDGEVHMHHNMPGGKNETHHMHEDGEVHLHHNMPGQENDTHHMHEDGEVHMHHNMPGGKNETHHMHEDGEVHLHHNMPGQENDTHHMHEDGSVHMHHSMPGWKNETHHMHEDGAVHLHHNMPGQENDTHHMHEDGDVHMHHNMPGWENDTHHMHEDGAVHMHHDMAGKDNETDHTSHVDEVHGRTAFGTLEKKNRAEDLGTFDLSILRVEPINSTSVVIRVGVSESVLSQILINENQHLKVLYSPDSQTWMEKNVSVSDIKVENMDEILLQVSDLEPSTPYQFRISYRDHVSSTSKARLLDASSDSGVEHGETIQSGCVIGTKFIEEKECGRHCTCAEDGLAQCFPRCPVVNLPEQLSQNCTMILSPEDPCCHVPDCLLNLFMQGGNGTFENLGMNNSDFGFIFNNATNDLGWAGEIDLRRMADGELELHAIGSSSGNVSLDILNKEHSGSPTEEHIHLNTLIPENNDHSFVQGMPMNSSVLPVEASGLHNQSSETSTSGFNEAGPTLRTRTEVPHTSVTQAEVHEETLMRSEHDEINLTHPPERDSQFPDVHVAENHMVPQDHDNIDVSNSSSQFPRGPFILFGNVEALNDSAGVDISVSHNLTGIHDENEVVAASHTPENMESIAVNAPGQINDGNSSLAIASTFDGESTHDASSQPNTQGSYLPNVDEASFRESVEGDDSFYLPEDDENFHHWEHTSQHTHQESDPATPLGIPNDHGDTHLLNLPGETAHVLENGNESHVTSVNENPSYIPSEREGSLFIPSGNEEPFYLPTTNGTPHYLPNTNEAPNYPHTWTEQGQPLAHPNEGNPSYLSTSETPTFSEGLPFASGIPPSSYNEADVSDHLKDNLQAGIHIDHSEMCSYNGRYYKRGQEFYEGCSQSCICSSNLEVHCAEIECPVTFGLQLYDPDCVEWDLDKDYIPTPPKCCPQVKCIQTSACEYMGQKFTNFDSIPRELTGCSQKCSCTYGNVTCIDVCPPISDTPPSELNCAPEDAIRVTLPGETCCETWQCAAQSVNGTPIEFPLPPESVHPQGFDNEVDLISRPHVNPLDATTAQIMFVTPNHYQGLPGELLVRYTSDPARQPNPEDWTREIIVPAGSTISQSKWDYILNDLKPSTQYAMQVMLTIMGADPIMSPVFSYNSPRGASTPPTTTPLARLDIDAQLYVSEITKTSAKVSWRIFNQEELKYIDGVQLKYIAKGKLIPKFSQMFHRNNDQMDLRDLQPGTEYTVDLVFITHKNQSTEVSNTNPYVFETLPEEDKYAFDIVITAGNVTSQTAEIFYSGVSELEEKLVHVYKAVYLREEGNIQSEIFKIPKADEERKIFLNELKPDVEYEVWLDAYLTNGRKKKSNVITIKTKAGQLPKPERSEVDPALSDKQIHYSYYPALVAVAIIAAIACVGFLGLLVILLRKQNHAKAHINSSRNNAAYDNPSYKVGDNGYDMEMNGIKGSGNGATHMEDP